jgi:hypothetical protein
MARHREIGETQHREDRCEADRRQREERAGDQAVDDQLGKEVQGDRAFDELAARTRGEAEQARPLQRLRRPFFIRRGRACSIPAAAGRL